MPKKIVTSSTLPKILRELDRWQGKLTWPLFCEHMAIVLGISSISKHTMYQYPVIKSAFKERQLAIRDNVSSSPRDFTLEAANKRISALEAEVKRLEKTNNLLLDQFRRWQYNAYSQNLDVSRLNLDSPLPPVDRK
tara:strand:- start:320 stop:727 length:408 start_codon:yes stop_codon:yes gene_type:complete